jgi:tetratricopeptide (TPR) repeat protein
METGINLGVRQSWLVVVSALLLSSPILIAQTSANIKNHPRTHATGTTDSAALDQMVHQADAARASGNPAEALRLYEKVLRSRPDWAEGWWYVGTIHYDANEFTQAIPALQKLLKLEPKLGPGWAFLGLCEYGTEKYAEALEHLGRANEFGFGDAATARVANYHRALLLNLNGRFGESTAVLSQQFGQEKISPQVAVAMGLALLEMPILPTQLDVTKKELVFSAGQASAEMSHGRYAEALALLKSIEKEHPDIPNVHYSAAKASAGLSQWEDAASQLQSELQINGKNVEAHLLLATVNLKLGKLDEALTAAKQATTIAPNDPEVHHVLSQCYTARGDDQQGAAELELAKSLGWNERSQAKEASIPASTTAPASTVESGEFEEWQKKASVAQQGGDTAAAIEAYREGLKLKPDWPEGLLNLATFSYSNQQFDEALSLSRRLSKIQPNVGATWALLGLCEFQLSDYEDAYVYLKRGQDIGFPPGTGGFVSEAYYHIGILLNWKGDFGSAHDLLVREAKEGTRAEDSKFALGINLLRLRLLPSQVAEPDRPMVQTASEIALDLTRSDYGAATTKFDELLRKYPGRAYIHDAYAWTLMSISRYDAAGEQYRQEIRLAPNSADAFLGVANAALKTHKYAEARDAAKKAIELSPDSAMAHAQYGRALVELSELNAGTAELEKAVQLGVAIPELHFSLSRAYAKGNRPADAERERQIFLRLSKKD